MMPHLAFALLFGSVVIAVPLLDKATESGASGQPQVAKAETGHAYQPRTVTLYPASSGHFITEARVNGRSVMMLADTGASAVVLTQQDARRSGFNPGSLDYSVPVSTANGTTHVAAVQIDRIEVEGIVVREVEALVAAPDALEQSLLGMSFIGRLSRFSLEGGRLVLVE